MNSLKFSATLIVITLIFIIVVMGYFGLYTPITNIIAVSLSGLAILIGLLHNKIDNYFSKRK